VTFKPRRFIGVAVVLAATTYGAVATRIEQRALRQQSAAISVAAATSRRIDAASLMRDVRALAAPEMEGRRTGSEGNRRARRLIVSAFREIGLEPLGGASGYEQPFSFVHSSVKGFLLPGRPWKTAYPDAANVIGRVAGADPRAKALVVSAHYDHLGVADGVPYPGADDNASGVAALLAIARVVHAHPLRHPVVLAAFDGEELGLEGAKAFLQHPPLPLSAMALNVNFDMVSRNDRNEIFAAGTYHYPWLTPILEEVRRQSAVKLLFGHDRPMRTSGMVEDWTLQSDHGAFHEMGVPFVYFGVEDHPDYHQPTDTADKIDPAFFTRVAEMLMDAVLAIDRTLP
jgi:hypothetical protein